MPVVRTAYTNRSTAAASRWMTAFHRSASEWLGMTSIMIMPQLCGARRTARYPDLAFKLSGG
jgi:hypothetical protein